MRFQLKLWAVFALFFSVMTGVVLFLSYQVQHKVVETIDTDLANLVHSVHASTQRLATVKNSDRDSLKKFITSAVQNPAVREVSVINKNHEVIASSNPRKIGKKHSADNRMLIVREDLGVDSQSPRHEHYQVTVPIVREGDTVGLVKTSFQFTDIADLLHRLNLQLLLLVGTILAVFFTIFSMVLYRMNTPIKQLCAAAERIAAGELAVTVSEERDDELGRLARTFNTMARTLTGQEEAKTRMAELQRRAALSEMVAMVAHEIRNPLNLIGLTADHLAHVFAGRDEQERRDSEPLLKNLKDQVRQMNRMVEQFISIGKPLTLHRERFLLEPFLAELEVMIKPHLMDKNASLTLDIAEGTACCADREQLRVAVQNIVLNAIQVGGHGCVITIAAHTSAGACTLRIADTGPGIAPEHIARIFEPYFTNRPGGSGLGLALVKRIIEDHGGAITASNNALAVGATFEIVLPE